MRTFLWRSLPIAAVSIALLLTAIRVVALEQMPASTDERLQRLEHRMDELAKRQESIVRLLATPEATVQTQSTPDSSAEVVVAGTNPEVVRTAPGKTSLSAAVVHSLRALLGWILLVGVLGAMLIFTDIRRLLGSALDRRISANTFREPRQGSRETQRRINDLIEGTTLTSPENVKLPWDICPGVPVRIEETTATTLTCTSANTDVTPESSLRKTYTLLLEDAACVLILFEDGTVADGHLRIRGKRVEPSEIPPSLLLNAQATLSRYLAAALKPENKAGEFIGGRFVRV